MKKDKILVLISLILFFLLFFLGTKLSQQKPLWNDELYSQNYVVEHLSVLRVLKGEIPEGNNSPFFYLLQKAVCRVLHFQLPFEWKGEWNVIEPKTQLVLRLVPNFFMVSGIVIIFYFFSRFYSFGIGFYSLALSLSSAMVWAYWVEARPYALWFFLTTCQCLLYLHLTRDDRKNETGWPWLTITNLLLSLTSAFGMVQVTVISCLLWARGYRNLSKYFLALLVPLVVGLFYYVVSPKYNFFVRPDFMSFVYLNIPVERIGIVFVYGFVLLWGWRKGFHLESFLSREALKPGISFFFLTTIMVIFSVVFTLFLKMKIVPNKETFDVSSRYFLYLTPVGIIAMTLFSDQIIKIFKRSPWLLMNLIILLGGLLVTRFLRFFIELAGLGVY